MAFTGDTDIVRRPQQALASDFIFHIVPLLPRVSVQLDTVSGSFPVAEYTVTYDPEFEADWLSVEEGEHIRIAGNETAGLSYYAVVRNAVTETTIGIPARQTGDTGISQLTARNPATGDTLTVYKNRFPWVLFARLSVDTIYKRYDVPYDTTSEFSRQTEYPAPLVRIARSGGLAGDIGGHGLYRADGITNLARVERQMLIDSWLGFSPTGYEWAAPTEWGSPTTGAVDEGICGWDIEPGDYILKATITEDTTEKTEIAYRYISVFGDGNIPFNELYSVTIVEDLEDTTGRNLTVEVSANADSNGQLTRRLYYGAAVMMQYKHQYSDDGWETSETLDHSDGIVDNYFGYLHSFEQVSRAGDDIDVWRLRILNPLAFTAELPFDGQILTVNEEPPENWAEVAAPVANVAYVDGYIIREHIPNLAWLHNLNPGDLDDFEAAAFKIEGGDPLTALRSITELCLGANIGCTSDGSIYLRRNPNYESADYRDNLDVCFFWEESDFLLQEGGLALSYNYNAVMGVGETEGEAFYSDTSIPPTGGIARAGLLAKMQGKRNERFFTIALNESDLLARTGHHHQILNNPMPQLVMRVPQGHDFSKPALMEWHNITLLDSPAGAPWGDRYYDPMFALNVNPQIYENPTSNGRWLCTNVARTWTFAESGELVKDIMLTFTPELTGKPAPLNPYATGGLPGTWCKTYDFTIDNGSFSTFIPSTTSAVNSSYWNGAARGEYITAKGWRTEAFTPGGGYGADARGLAIKKTITGSTITELELAVNVRPQSEATFVGISVQGYWFVGSTQYNGANLVNQSGALVYRTPVDDTVSVTQLGFHLLLFAQDDTLDKHSFAVRLTIRGRDAFPSELGTESNCI